jgi:hypothetical protein
LILYSATLPYSFISFDSFVCHLVESKFSTYKIMSLVNRDNFTSSFPIQMPFASLFSCLTALERIFSNTKLKRYSENRIFYTSYLAPDLRRNVFRFSSLTINAF